LAGGAAVENSVQDRLAGDRPFNSQCPFGDAAHQFHAVDLLDPALAHRAAAQIAALHLSADDE